MSAHSYSLWLLARRSLRQHALSTTVTALSLALASGLVMAVLAIGAQSRTAFTIESTPFDAVLGARGSQLQLVLNSVFHLETSPGNLPWSTYEDVRAKPGVRAAIPYAVGDSWRGFRVVGTDARMFDNELLGERTPRVASGRIFD
jgi:putative ABC transport system permease protein